MGRLITNYRQVISQVEEFFIHGTPKTVSYFAVFLTKGWSHAGILCHGDGDSNGESGYFHLDKECKFMAFECREALHVDLCIDEERSAIIFDFLVILRKLSASGMTRWPYGTKYRGVKFTSLKGASLSSEYEGLSCSTFVLAVLDLVNVRIINISDWLKHSDDPDYIRVRPEFLFASCCSDLDNRPVSFEQMTADLLSVKNELKSKGYAVPSDAEEKDDKKKDPLAQFGFF